MSDDANVFVRVLAKTLSMTEEDIEDLRAMFEFYRLSGSGTMDSERKGNMSRLCIEAADAINALRRMGLPNARLERNGGVLVQEGTTGQLVVNEQEFLLVAARLWPDEGRGPIPGGNIEMHELNVAELHAARLFHIMDPMRTGFVSASLFKSALYNLGCHRMDDEDVAALCDKWGDTARVLDQEDFDERYLTMEEFVKIAVRLILPTVQKKLDHVHDS